MASEPRRILPKLPDGRILVTPSIIKNPIKPKPIQDAIDPHTSTPNSVCIQTAIPDIPSEDKETTNEEEISLTNFEDGDSGSSIDFGNESDTVDGANPEGNDEANDSNTFHNLVETMEPSLLWQLVKDKVAPSLKVWDFLSDKASAALVVEDDPMVEEGGPACKDPEYQARKLQTYRLKVLLEELGELVMNMGKMVQACCVDADDPDPPKPPGSPPNKKRRRKVLGPSPEDEEELVLAVNKTLSRVLMDKIPNTSGNGFKIRRDIPVEYSNVFHVDTPITEPEEDTSYESEQETIGQTFENRNYSDTNNAAILKGNNPEGEDLQTDALESLVNVVFTPSPSADHSEAFRCGQCFKICSNAGALKRHIESHEPRECRHCGEFVYRDEKRNIGQKIRDHELSCRRRLARAQKKLKRHFCCVCKKDFQWPSELKRHSCKRECIHCKAVFSHGHQVKNHKCPNFILNAPI